MSDYETMQSLVQAQQAEAKLMSGAAPHPDFAVTMTAGVLEVRYDTEPKEDAALEAFRQTQDAGHRMQLDKVIEICELVKKENRRLLDEKFDLLNEVQRLRDALYQLFKRKL